MTNSEIRKIIRAQATEEAIQKAKTDESYRSAIVTFSQVEARQREEKRGIKTPLTSRRQVEEVFNKMLQK